MRPRCKTLSRLLLAAGLAWAMGCGSTPPGENTDQILTELEAATSSCFQACVEQGRQAYGACIAAGGGEEACRMQAHEAVRTCARDNQCPRPDCAERCRHLAQRVRQACLDRGVAQERCDRLASEVGTRCARRCECALGCRHQAAEAFRACREAGGSWERCLLRAGEELRGCIRNHCAP
jgi:hypothetical protein